MTNILCIKMANILREEHSKHLRLSLKHFWQEQILTDITIIVEGKRFQCHKVILASMSFYYQTLFSSSFEEAHQKELYLPVDCDIFEEVLEFMYCVKDKLNTRNAEGLFNMANFLQIEALKEVLEVQFLNDLSVENCFESLRLADLYNCPRLLERSLTMCSNNIENGMTNSHFLLLKGELICSLLCHTDLKLSSEEKIFQAVSKWYHANESEKMCSLGKLLEHIRFPQMSEDFLQKVVAKEKFMKEHKYSKFIKEAKTYHDQPHLRHTYSSLRTIPRKCEEINMFCVVGCKSIRKKDGSFSQVEPTVHMFDLTTLKWYRTVYLLKDKLRECTNFAVCPYKNGLYISGGPSNCKGLSFLNIESKVHTKRKQMTANRMFHCVVAIKNKLFAFGGKNLKDERLSSVEMIDFDAKRGWQVVGHLAEPVSDTSACVNGNKIFIFGGLTDDACEAAIQCFDTVKNQGYIVKCTNVPDQFIMPKSVLCDNRIIVVCGDGSVHEFFPRKLKFEKLGQIQSFLKKYYYGCVQYKGSIFVFGGVGMSTDVLSFNLQTRQTKYHYHKSPDTCQSVYGGFFTSTKLRALGQVDL